MKVLIFSNYYAPNIIGGAEVSTQLLAESLLLDGYLPIIVTLGDSSGIRYVNKIKVYEISRYNIFTINLVKRKNTLLKAIWHIIDIKNYFIKNKIRKIFYTEKPQITHTNNLQGFSPIIWEISKEFNVPIVHTLRDYYLLCPNTQLFAKDNINPNNVICKLFSFQKKVISNNVDYVVGISQFILDLHLKMGYFRTSRSEVIYNGVNKLERRKKLNKPPTFGFIGRIEKSKGIELLLELFSKELKDFYLHIYGETKDINYFRSLKEKYNFKNISFKGKERISTIFQTIDVSIVPSIWKEPFGRVVIESFSYGVAVIATKSGGLIELVEDGVNGFLVDVNCTKDIVNLVKKIASDDKLLSRVSQNAFESAHKYLHSNTLSRYENIYTNYVV